MGPGAASAVTSAPSTIFTACARKCLENRLVMTASGSPAGKGVFLPGPALATVGGSCDRPENMGGRGRRRNKRCRDPHRRGWLSGCPHKGYDWE